MVETVNPNEFVTQQQKKRIEDYEFVKVQLGGGVAHMTEAFEALQALSAGGVAAKTKTKPRRRR